MQIKINNMIPENGVASEGEAWIRKKHTESELIYVRDCSYDKQEHKREEKTIKIIKDDKNIEMTVNVVIDGTEYNYKLVSYDFEESVLKRFHSSNQAIEMNNPSSEKVESIFKDKLYDETRHGKNRYQLYQ